MLWTRCHYCGRRLLFSRTGHHDLPGGQRVWWHSRHLWEGTALPPHAPLTDEEWAAFAKRMGWEVTSHD